MEVRIYGSFDGPVADGDTTDRWSHPALPGLSVAIGMLNTTHGLQPIVAIDTAALEGFETGDGYPVLNVSLNDSDLYDVEPGRGGQEQEDRRSLSRYSALAMLTGSGADCYEALSAHFGLTDEDIDRERERLERPVPEHGVAEQARTFARETGMTPEETGRHVEAETDAAIHYGAEEDPEVLRQAELSAGAAAAEVVLDTYSRVLGRDAGDPGTTIQDLITDLLLVHAKQDDDTPAEELVRMAYDRFTEEQRPPQPERFEWSTTVVFYAPDRSAAVETVQELAGALFDRESSVELRGDIVRSAGQ